MSTVWESTLGDEPALTQPESQEPKLQGVDGAHTMRLKAANMWRKGVPESALCLLRVQGLAAVAAVPPNHASPVRRVCRRCVDHDSVSHQDSTTFLMVTVIALLITGIDQRGCRQTGTHRLHHRAVI